MGRLLFLILDNDAIDRYADASAAKVVKGIFVCYLLFVV